MGLPRASRLALLLLATACGKEIKQSYTLDIVGMEGDVFGQADRALLLLNGREVSRTNVRPKTAFSLEVPNLDPNTTAHAVFAVRAEKSDGTLVAYGRTPDVEVILASASLRVFVQPPGTLAHGQDTDTPFAGHVAAAAMSAPVPPLELPMAVPIFGLGTSRFKPSTDSTTTVSLATALIYVYSPLSHISGDLDATLPRARAAATTRADGSVFIFGGVAELANGSGPQASGFLDVYSIQRYDLSNFELSHLIMQDAPAAARSDAVLVPFDKVVYAFGGLDKDKKPVDSVVKIDIDSDATSSVACAGCPRSYTAKLLAARAGHSATLVSPSALKREALVFGGADAATPIAEVFDPASLTGTAVDAPMGSGRRNHAALLIKNDPATGASRVLIVGGSDGSKALDDSLVYDSGTRTFKPGTIKLKTARHSFTAFVLNNDVVIYGGYGPDGAPLADGEIFDLETLLPAGTFTSPIARAGATATLLSNESAILCGGFAADKLAMAAGNPAAVIESNLVEIYQPRR
jgi:hypothetical protein